MSEIKLKCCHIDDRGQELLQQPGMSEGDKRMVSDRHSCKAAATWEICYGHTVDDYTHACDDHAGHLMLQDRLNTVAPIGMPAFDAKSGEKPRVGQDKSDCHGDHHTVECFIGKLTCEDMKTQRVIDYVNIYGVAKAVSK
jgi:hypothetical protein